MNRFRHVLIIGIIAAAAVFALYQTMGDTVGVSDALEENPETGLEVGSKAPAFELQGIDGEVVALGDMKKPVMLNFWASWCPPCRAEMPHMVNFHEAYDHDVEILAVNMTHQESIRAEIADFQDDYRLGFPIPLDHDGEVSGMYQIRSIPTSYFINSDGYIEVKYTGPMTQDFIEDTFSRID